MSPLLVYFQEGKLKQAGHGCSMGISEDTQASLPVTGFYCMHSSASSAEGSIPMPIPLTSGVRFAKPLMSGRGKSISWEWPCPKIPGGIPGTFLKEKRSGCMPGQQHPASFQPCWALGAAGRATVLPLPLHSRGLGLEDHCVLVTRCVRDLIQTFKETKLQIRSIILCGNIKNTLCCSQMKKKNI